MSKFGVEVTFPGVNNQSERVELITDLGEADVDSVGLPGELKRRGVFDIASDGVVLNMAVNPWGIGPITLEGGRVSFAPGKTVAKVESGPTTVYFADGRVARVVEMAI